MSKFSLGLSAAIGAGTLALTYWLMSRKKKEKKDRTIDLPVIDFSTYEKRQEDPARYAEECKKVADALHNYGVLVVKDPRVDESDNSTFLNMMERYFEASDGQRDARPEHSYQVGVTPSFVEKPKNHCNRVGALGPDDKPLSPCPPEKDPKWRFFWRVGPRPKTTNFPDLNADPVIPPEIPEWSLVMDTWGNKMLGAVERVSEMAAEGFGLPADSFQKMFEYGPHLLAPTGSDFNRFGQTGTVLAGFHYDLNFITVHGKSRFPGLNIWTREGERVGVKVPAGCLFMQAGKQIEYLTGGHVLAGFHEVIVTDATVRTIEEKKLKGESLWRVSSTLFGHLQSDHVLEPMGKFSTPETRARFPPIKVGDQVKQELLAINLDQSEG